MPDFHWQSGTAQLLPRLIARRTRGPLFLTDRQGPGRNPDARRVPGDRPGPALLPPGRGDLRGEHPTHDAEDGTSTPMLLARFRHAAVRSLERYARPGVDSVARHVAERDPAARRRT
jgi:integrase/recombinase XerD